ncbi:hypothetical protein LDG_5026 [Legionella drancourtii LLAP12]|uniref:Uncharacterized protein n=1 Tax=Legionella drancourtii LLAP12 TaxID=658187 RepID=G9EIM0_9GAMM|nr:hypothetical protein LDG_5026 [Legionella drancourtii LLAP12]
MTSSFHYKRTCFCFFDKCSLYVDVFLLRSLFLILKIGNARTSCIHWVHINR